MTMSLEVQVVYLPAFPSSSEEFEFAQGLTRQQKRFQLHEVTIKF